MKRRVFALPLLLLLPLLSFLLRIEEKGRKKSMKAGNIHVPRRCSRSFVQARECFHLNRYAQRPGRIELSSGLPRSKSIEKGRNKNIFKNPILYQLPLYYEINPLLSRVSINEVPKLDVNLYIKFKITQRWNVLKYPLYLYRE